MTCWTDITYNGIKVTWCDTYKSLTWWLVGINCLRTFEIARCLYIYIYIYTCLSFWAHQDLNPPTLYVQSSTPVHLHDVWQLGAKPERLSHLKVHSLNRPQPWFCKLTWFRRVLWFLNGRAPIGRLMLLPGGEICVLKGVKSRTDWASIPF